MPEGRNRHLSDVRDKGWGGRTKDLLADLKAGHLDNVPSEDTRGLTTAINYREGRAGVGKGRGSGSIESLKTSAGLGASRINKPEVC
jgi:hypothetical protein